MKKLGYVKVACGIPVVALGDPQKNTEEILKLCEEAWQAGVGIVLFPELCITGYTCGDLFGQSLLLTGVSRSLKQIGEWSDGRDMVIVVSAPIPVDGAVYNCAVVFNDGDLLGAVPKIYIPNSNEFDEKRWFASGRKLNRDEVSFGGFTFPIGTDLLFRDEEWPDLAFGIEVSEDLCLPVPPSGALASAGAVLLLNTAASNETAGKWAYRRKLVASQSARCKAAYLYASAGTGESTSDMVFGGHGMIDEKGHLLAESQPFGRQSQLIISDVDVEGLQHDRRTMSTFADMAADLGNDNVREVYFTMSDADVSDYPVNPTPFIPKDPIDLKERCEEVLSIQMASLTGRLSHLGEPAMVIGISGGLDSTLALLVCAGACDRLGMSRSMIHAVTMPGFGTTDRTYTNALALIEDLGATFHEISIKEACLGHFRDIGQDENLHDVTYENAQARERTQILMDLANMLGGIVIGTGDLSELALGWATYNGDHMSMYGVNAGVPKTLIRHIVSHCAKIFGDEMVSTVLWDILDTPVSPELLPPDEASGAIAQKTEDLVGPYELHDFFLYYMMRYGFSPEKIFFMAKRAFEGRYDDATLYHWLHQFYRRFFAMQFKRSCLPDGPKVGAVSLSSRGDWRMPSDAKASLWLRAVEALKDEIQ